MTLTTIPDSNTLKIVADESAGLYCPNDVYVYGTCRFLVVTPKVVEVGRWYFGCDSLEGVELENQPTTTCGLIGSHWESRMWRTEVRDDILSLL